MTDYQILSQIKSLRSVNGFDVVMGKSMDKESMYATWLQAEDKRFLFHYYKSDKEALRDMLIRADRENGLNMEDHIIREDEFKTIQDTLNLTLSKPEAEEYINDEEFIINAVKNVRKNKTTISFENVYRIVSDMIDEDMEEGYR